MSWLGWIEPVLVGGLTLVVVLTFAAQWLLVHWLAQDWPSVALLAGAAAALIALFVWLTPPEQRVYRTFWLIACVGVCAWILQGFGFTLPGLLGLI